MVAGTMFGHISQSAAPLLITGDTYNTLLPGPGGSSGTIAGATMSAFTPVPDSEVRGFIACYGSEAFCVALFGASSGEPIPQTPPGGSVPFPVPNVKFGATVGVGGWTADPKTDVVNYTTPTGTVPLTYVSTVYKGTELSRYYITGDVSALGGGALLGIAAFLLVGGTSTLALRNRRS